MSEANRVVVVTGGTRGIGAAIVKSFLAAGDRVFFSGTREETVAAAISEFGSGVQGDVVDVRSSESVALWIKQIVATAGRLDVLVNNAGIARDNLLMRMKEDEWDAVLDTNLKGAYYTAKSAIRPMLKQRSGRIINITSIAGLVGNAGQSNYAASKAGLIGFTYSLAREVGSRGITVNAVAPGFIETDMTAAFKSDEGGGLHTQIPLRRFGSAKDIASAVEFLASEAASYITGTVLRVDGGLAIGS